MIPDFIKKRLPLYLALALALATALLYLPSTGFDFINMDDPQYVVENEIVQKGLTVWGVKSVFTTPMESYWIPVTWISLMTDAEFFGLGAGGFHRTNVLLHALNVLLLFAFLHRATGSPWKSFFAAALWALHPMRVESVAWITARKDLLSGFFFLAGLLAYLEYAKNRKKWGYSAALALMFIGLASKPIVVVFPVVLLIVDLWPLERYSGKENLQKLLLEKIPFFALGGLFALLTIRNQSVSLVPGDAYPLSQRVSDVATSYFYYINEALWPAKRLILDRTSSIHLTGFGALLAWVFLLLVTFEAWKKKGKFPAVNASWLWYLATMLPVSGIVAVGLNSVADRFTYLPHIGLSILTVWGLDAVIGNRRDLRKAAVGFFFICAALLAFASGSYLMKWKNGVTLFSYQVENGGSGFAERVLAGAYEDAGRNEEALTHFKISVEKEPGEAITYNNMGVLLGKMGRHEEAAEAFKKSLDINSWSWDAHFNLAVASATLRDEATALAHYLQAISINPSHWPSLYNAGLIYSGRGDYASAVPLFQKAAWLRPGNSGAYKELAIALAKTGREQESVGYFERAVEIEPENPDHNFNLALALFKTGQTGRAAAFFEKTLSLDPSNGAAHFNYGLMLEKTGKRKEAQNHFREVLKQYPGNEEALKALLRTGEGADG
ncbi:tetratricopeptide repeat protein [bacterium]|nr:MAG: tetratricopeptide repeat protein [bacterium]